MLKQLINFYKVSSPRPCNGEALSSSGSQHLHSDARRLKYLKWSTFFQPLSVTACTMFVVLA